MNDHDSEGWSTPSIFSSSVLIEPRTFAEADPMSGGVLLEDDSYDRDAQPTWSPPTYIGRRRHRPRAGTQDVAPPSAGPPTTVMPAVTVEPELTAEPDLEQASTSAPMEADRGLMSSSRTMAIASLVSRITGFLRSSLLVVGLGVHEVGDAYNVANNFPNMVYELLLGGVLSSVLIPLLVHAQEKDEDEGVAYTQRLLSVATAALGVMTLVAVLCAPLIAAAFVPDPAERSLTSIFATLLLPEIFFYGVGAMLMAVLNIRHRYGPGAWSPVLNNVIMIVTVGVFLLMRGPSSPTPANMSTSQILVLGIGTTLGIAAQALVLIPSLRRSGFVWQWRFRARPNEAGRMKEVGSLGGWVLAYVIASQIGVTVVAKVGVGDSGFTIFTNADLLFQMPYGILVVSLLTALMPRLSRSAARGETSAVVKDLSLGARLSAIALIPITAGLIVLGPVLTIVLFSYHDTSITDAKLIGTSLALSAFGLFPFALVMLQLRVFYAMRDGRTPTLINVFMVTTKVVLILVGNAMIHNHAHQVEWLNVSTSISYVVGAVAGHLLIGRRLGRLGFRAVGWTVLQIGIASAIGAVVADAVVAGCSSAFGDARAGALTGLVGGSIAGIAVLGLVVWRLRLPELRMIRGIVRR
jgi:putative peptidoglycan lipid II flippase